MDKIFLIIGILYFNPEQNSKMFVVQDQIFMPNMMLCSQAMIHIIKERTSPQIAMCTVVPRKYTPPTQKPRIPEYGSPKNYP